jgi:hypothetical protein
MASPAPTASFGLRPRRPRQRARPDRSPRRASCLPRTTNTGFAHDRSS